jgi:hypothetical protein
MGLAAGTPRRGSTRNLDDAEHPFLVDVRPIALADPVAMRAAPDRASS